MFQTIWFFIKIGLVSAAAIWLVTLEGQVSIDLLNYKINVQAGLFFFGLVSLIWIFITLLRLIHAVFKTPKKLMKLYEADKRKKSFRALTRGLVAVAAGDVKRATQYSKQTKALWPDINGLPLLLEAQSAKLRGEDGLAQNRFERLLKNKDAAFLGVRGLLKSALDEGNFQRALDFARQAEKQHPKKSWIVKCVYELEIKNRLWTDALRTNHKLKKIKKENTEQLNKDRIAIYLHHHDKNIKKGYDRQALSEVEKAYKLDPSFVPTIVRYCDYLLREGKRKKAIKIVEQAWQVNSHPDLADIWRRLEPTLKGKSAEKDYEKLMAWYERLIDLNSENADGHIAAAKAAMHMEYWGEAKSYLMTAENIYPSAQIYRLQAIVEQNSTQNDEAIHRLMDRASNALADKKWICSETGMTYDHWNTIAQPHGSFNTMIWDSPGARILQEKSSLSLHEDTALLIDPAA